MNTLKPALTRALDQDAVNIDRIIARTSANRRPSNGTVAVTVAELTAMLAATQRCQVVRAIA